MRNSNSPLPVAAAIVAAWLALAAPARAAEADDIQALREQIRLLDQKLRVLERKQELKDEDAGTAAKTAPKVTVSDKGVTLASADAANSIRIRGLVQFDSRVFLGDRSYVANTAFLLRRARLISEGTFAKDYSFQVVTEFAGSTPSVVDANIGVALSKTTQLKFGRFKVPVGLEWLQSDSWSFFAERSIVTNLVPNRDIGVQLSGELAQGVVSYAAGVFGGVADASNTTNTDFDNDKAVAARLWVQPFKNASESPAQGLGFGLGADTGRQKSAAALTGGYKTDGQQTFFKYRSTVVGDGATWRVSPQAEYRNGPFGLLAEYVVSTVNAHPTATGRKAELQNKAWQLAAGYVLTGEKSSYNGVVPRLNFNPAAGTWGAFEIVARYADLKIDSAAFPLFADPAVSANEAASFGLGLNWYLSKAVRGSFDFFDTSFTNGVAVPTTTILRQNEKAFTTRVQLSF
jgi:phosphate-selective porin OprO and OprP